MQTDNIKKLKIWSDEESEALTKLYIEQKKSVVELSQIFDRGTRSIISKLVQLKIYNKPISESDENQSVKEMLQEIEKLLDIKIEGLSLTRKSNLKALLDSLKRKLKND